MTRPARSGAGRVTEEAQSHRASKTPKWEEGVHLSIGTTAAGRG